MMSRRFGYFVRPSMPLLDYPCKPHALTESIISPLSFITYDDAHLPVIEGLSKKLSFTHHQKYVIVDTPRVDGEGRELFAFVGGIDLTLGRWDNRKHPLFRSLQSTHKGDTYTKCFKVSNEHGPRQPWHDIHSAVRGPEAISLARAFEERWTKQANAGELISRSRLGLDNELTLENKGGWCAQVSIVLFSAQGIEIEVMKSLDYLLSYVLTTISSLSFRHRVLLTPGLIHLIHLLSRIFLITLLAMNTRLSGRQ